MKRPRRVVLDVELLPSRILAAVLVTAHVAALIVLWPLEIDALWKTPAAIVILVSAQRAVLCDALRIGADAVVHLEFDDADGCVLAYRDGVRIDARIRPDTFVTGFGVVLRLRFPGSWWSSRVVVLRDACDARSFRRMRVWLRWGTMAAGGE